MKMQQNNARTRFQQTRRLVIKIGSSLLTQGGKGLDKALISDWVRQIAQLKESNQEVLLVSSGAVAEGMQRLGIKVRPETLHELQATAAVGQMGLIQTYESAFQQHGLHTAQVLLTHPDLANRTGYLNARSTLKTLLQLNVIPVINENDTVATEEIRFGDNDNLAASVCNLVEAGLLILLTDQKGIYDKEPSDPEAKLMDHAFSHDPVLQTIAAAGGVSAQGRGGMVTKVEAARRAARAGAATIIADGREQDVLLRLHAGEALGSLLEPPQEPVAARKRWLAAQLPVKGSLTLDPGAVKVLVHAGRSLLPVGVTRLTGQFQRGDLVSCVDADGREIARGLVNYSSLETSQIIGKSSHKIQETLGYVDDPELIHRDNLTLS